MKFSWVCDLIRSNNKGCSYMALAWIFILLFAVACASHPKGPPGKDIMKSDCFVEFLLDMHYSEGIYSVSFSYINYPDKSELDTLDFYQQLFDKYDIDREVFKKTMEYYSYNPHQFEAIYDRVVDKLNNMEDEFHMHPENSKPNILDDR